MTAVRGGFGKVADVKAHEQVVMGGVTWLIHPAQLAVRFLVPSLAKRREATSVLDECQIERGAQRQRSAFDPDGQILGCRVIAAMVAWAVHACISHTGWAVSAADVRVVAASRQPLASTRNLREAHSPGAGTAVNEHGSAYVKGRGHWRTEKEPG